MSTREAFDDIHGEHRLIAIAHARSGTAIWLDR